MGPASSSSAKDATLNPFPDSVGVFSGGAGAEAAYVWAGDADLQRRYDAYCIDQARELLRVIPRSAIRPLMRAARAAEASLFPSDDTDPMELLVRYARSILPLPPLSVWVDDVRRAPLDHLQASAPVRARDIRRAPTAVASRDTVVGGDLWTAVLMVFPEPGSGRWSGFVAFGEGPGRLLHRTADIFRESDPELIRDRFLSSDAETLQALLRSASL